MLLVLLADIDTSATGPAALVVSGIVLAAIVAERLSKARKQLRTDSAEASVVEADAAVKVAEAEEKESDILRRRLKATRREVRQIGEAATAATLTAANALAAAAASQAAHADCEKRVGAMRQELDDVQQLSSRQQVQLDAVDKGVGRIKSAIGLPDGSGPHVAMPDQPRDPRHDAGDRVAGR